MSGDVALRLIEGLPQRFRAERVIRDARFRISLDGTQRDVAVSSDGCRVGEPRGTPDAEIRTDASTWVAIDEGRLSGIEAFGRRRLTVRGSIEAALHFEPLFDRPAAGGLVYSVETVTAANLQMSVLTAGAAAAEPLLLLHGLGATKASWLTVLPELARNYRVIALDLPGFGASSKPWARYDSPWFARQAFGLLDALGYDAALVAGNSMGGKIAMEMAMLHADRVEGIACLCPAAAFSRRPMLFLARLLRPELGVVATRLSRARVLGQLRAMVANPDNLDEDWYEAAVDDFLRVWRSPRARTAFFRAAKEIYLEEPEGEAGFWARLQEMQRPALFIYGERDPLISHHFGRKIEHTLPEAKVLVWRDCGHVPQLEHPHRTAAAMLDFFSGTAGGRVAS
jgi:pimeloyl-ACP methyl ester carboxylesterase